MVYTVLKLIYLSIKLLRFWVIIVISDLYKYIQYVTFIFKTLMDKNILYKMIYLIY